MEKAGQENVSSVLKVFTILQALGEQKEIGVSELSQKLEMSKATTYRFLQTMKTLGFVDQEGEADKYSLTLKLFDLGVKSLRHGECIPYVNEQMRMIAEQTHEALHMGVLNDNAIVYVHKIDSAYNLSMQSRIGRGNPLYSTAIGKVLLCERDESFVRARLKGVQFVKHTQYTLENVEQFLEELKRVRQQYFAEDKEEQEVGLRCIAVPVYEESGNIVAALSISFPTVRFSNENKLYYVGLLHQAAKNISCRLGYPHYPV